MKNLETLTYNNQVLTVLITVEEESRVYAEYFINGYLQCNWELILPIYQKLLSTMLDNYCEVNNLTKWSY